MANLIDMIMGRGGQPQQAQAAASPMPQQQAQQPNRFAGMMPVLNDVFTGLAMGANSNDAVSKAGLMLAQGNEKRRGQQAKSRTIQWLQEQGVGEQEAQILASDPKAFSAWYGEYRNAGKPDWKITEIY